MRISIINIANKMPAWIISACNEYLKRINHGQYSVNVIEIKADKNPHKSPAEQMELEAKKITVLIPKASFVIALDERGAMLSSPKFAQLLAKTTQANPSICFIVGGADGLAPSIKQQANYCLSLSSLVFPHALVRVILLEQIYRAISILENHPYHRE